MSDKEKKKNFMEIPNTEEHIEAHQAQVHANRKKFYKTLSEDDQAKFKAVDKAFEILTEAGVPSYIFAQLPQPKIDVPRCWQVNNVFEVIGYDDKGGVKKEAKDVSDDMIRSMMESFFTAHKGNPLHWMMLQNAAIERSAQREREGIERLKEKGEEYE